MAWPSTRTINTRLVLSASERRNRSISCLIGTLPDAPKSMMPNGVAMRSAKVALTLPAVLTPMRTGMKGGDQPSSPTTSPLERKGLQEVAMFKTAIYVNEHDIAYPRECRITVSL